MYIMTRGFEDKSSSITLKYRPVHFANIAVYAKISGRGVPCGKGRKEKVDGHIISFDEELNYAYCRIGVHIF